MSYRIALLLPVLLVASGCSSTTSSGDGVGGAKIADELREVGSLVGVHAAKGRKVAPTPAQLNEYEATFPLAVKALRAGTIEAVWNLRPNDEETVAKGMGGKAIIAYEKKAATSGGEVLLQNGDTRTLTAEEFAVAKASGAK